MADSTKPIEPMVAGLTIALMSSPRLRRIIVFSIALATATVFAQPFVAAAPPRGIVLIVGDSISAGLGLPPATGWATLLDARLRNQHYPYDVVNASISGDTTAGGRARLPALLATHHPAIVVIELGGNDGLRGGDLTATAANLDAMIVAAQKSGAKVLLIGMQLPPNYGAQYTSRFAALFNDASRRHKTALVPFFFEGFADRNELFQADRIHPTEAAQARLLDNVWPVLQRMLGKPR